MQKNLRNSYTFTYRTDSILKLRENYFKLLTYKIEAVSADIDKTDYPFNIENQRLIHQSLTHEEKST